MGRCRPRALRLPAETNALDEFSTAVESMVQRVSPAVVQILATRYGLVEDSARTNMSAGVEQSVGSGVIVSPDGFVITNAHVVQNAYDIRIRLVPRGKQTIGDVLSQSFAPTLEAALVGTYREADLALLKIEGDNLPSLPIAGPDRLRQGQVAFAFGSPNGLQNSVTMGVVSSIARQLHPDDPLLYIQTDTPINPGNSGGPLVDTSGSMLGLNTFISTQSGGSEGMGFAIPAGLVQWVYEQLKKHGHVHRPTIGAGLQTITPPLAAALKLARGTGVIVSDLPPDSPAATAGMKLNDILLTVNGRQMDNVAAWIGSSFQYVPGSAMTVEVLRGTTTALALDCPTRSGGAERTAGRPRRVLEEPGVSARHHGRDLRRSSGGGHWRSSPGVRRGRDGTRSDHQRRTARPPPWRSHPRSQWQGCVLGRGLEGCAIGPVIRCRCGTPGRAGWSDLVSRLHSSVRVKEAARRGRPPSFAISRF